MSGQTKRAGPWESNLGLEPEWDGAFGQFWPVECEQLPETAKGIKFAGSIVHEERTCRIKLFTPLSTQIIQEEELSAGPQLIDPSLWQGHVELPDESGTVREKSITVFGYLNLAGTSFSRHAYSLQRFTLEPLWIIEGAHIEAIEKCCFNKISIQTNTLPGLLSNRTPPSSFYKKEDSDNEQKDFQNPKYDVNAFKQFNDINNEAKLKTLLGETKATLISNFLPNFSTNITLGTKLCFETYDSINFSFPKPVPILEPEIFDSEMIEPTPLSSIWHWANWLISLLEMIGNIPTSSVSLYGKSVEGADVRIYINLNLARKDHSLDQIANKIRLDPVGDENPTKKWGLLLNTWLNVWKLESCWFIAVDNLRHILRLADEAIPSLIPYFLYAVQTVEARWYAEHGEYKSGTSERYRIEEIVKSTLYRAEVISKDLEDSVGDGFNTETLSKVITTIRNEFTHPATKNKRLKLRELLWRTDNSDVYFIADLLISAALKLIKREVFAEHVIPNAINRNVYKEEYGREYRLHLRRWRQLKEACSA